jgi:pimeloyl-ACP methyl ester carboxylesterase
MAKAAVDGIQLDYRERGEGTPLLFIHGTGAHGVVFEPCVEQLPAGYRSIVYDRRGYGATGGAPAKRFGDQATDAAALIRQLDIAPATVIAVSGAGPIALQLALANPELVRGLVLGEPAFQIAMIPDPGTLAANTTVNVDWLVRRNPEAAATRFYRWATARSNGSNQFDEYPAEWREPALGHARTALRELMQLAAPRPSTKAVREIKCPVTLLIGDVGQPVFHKTTRRLERALADPTVVEIDDAAHILSTDQPAAFARAVAEAAPTPAADAAASEAGASKAG